MQVPDDSYGNRRGSERKGLVGLYAVIVTVTEPDTVRLLNSSPCRYV